MSPLCPKCLEQNTPAATEDIDFTACMPWLVRLGFDPIDVFEMVTDLRAAQLAAQQRTEDSRAV